MKVAHINRTDGNIVEIIRGDYMGIEAYRYTARVNFDTRENTLRDDVLHCRHICYTLAEALEFSGRSVLA